MVWSGGKSFYHTALLPKSRSERRQRMKEKREKRRKKTTK
jgi:hypothetical protein